MNELPRTPENESAAPRLKQSIIDQVARSVYAELSCKDGFDCFSGSRGDPVDDDEDTLIKRSIEQSMAISSDAIPEDAVEQYKQAIEQAGGLEQFLDAAADRREARERQAMADAASRREAETTVETPDPQTGEVPSSKRKLGGSAIGRLFRR